MVKRKLEKFAALDTFPNVLQNRSFKDPKAENAAGEIIPVKGRWNELQFGNKQPIVVELACGKGEYTVAMAKLHPHKNFIGVDIKGNRMHTGAKQALEEGIHNAVFLRTEIYLLPHFFSAEEISEIWVTFPDPHLRPSKDQQRLTSERFINIYRSMMPKGGIIHLKTDDPTLYEFTVQTVSEVGATMIYHHNDIYSGELFEPLLEVKTYYERMHLKDNRKIKYIKFSI
jgi:tRNA (guanine-N7-)-methyltransferase